ncbi:MAG: hypothetical protein CL926_09340 [Deltaproteobacteria bacterium]|jgi:hypothetical protein|nr:hypothetical protein [Gammaproteobacteria bacterium]MBP79459.1 hypothetical protein [Deltaproteobacteria bacterium]MDA9901857.1 hypothetical protein [Gammaproteobacteria bacterium]MDB2444573.1 hypothetical protein [Gammaproteobacteria bacterium]MDC3340079.1 hypothetical protein [bacterium]|tara:strand:- start:4 stop:375 length:372 start_codon:yes stop_codon:yes gene_type:complete
MDLSNPDGRGSLKITRMTISEDSTSFDFEGRVEGYGSPFLTHEYFHNAQDRSRGKLIGEARTFLEDGTLISTPHMGTFRREQSNVYVYFADACNNGAVNFVMLNVDILTKEVDLKFWEIRSAD